MCMPEGEFLKIQDYNQQFFFIAYCAIYPFMTLYVATLYV